MKNPLSMPIALPCGGRLTNRIAKAALTEGLADPNTSHANERHCRLYRRWSLGGAGLLITGNVQVDRRFLERPGNVALDSFDSKSYGQGMPALRSYAREGTAGGNHLWMQLNHPGRQTPAYVTSEPLAPSAVPLALPGFGMPRAMTSAEILEAIERFANSAALAREAGFTGVQIHAAHGYLISRFLNPLVNRRDDEWGGSLENRVHLLMEIVSGVRRSTGPDFPVSVKLNSSDFQQGGFTSQDCIQVAGWLDAAGIDLLEISGGNYEQPSMVMTGRRNLSESTKRREAYFLEYASMIRSATCVPLMLTGGFRTSSAMNTALRQNEIDMVGLGRPMIVWPDAPRRLLADAESCTVPSPELTLRLNDTGALTPDEREAARTWGIQAWFATQLTRLGDGLDPDLNLDVKSALRSYLATERAGSRGHQADSDNPGFQSYGSSH